MERPALGSAELEILKSSSPKLPKKEGTEKLLLFVHLQFQERNSIISAKQEMRWNNKVNLYVIYFIY